ncbi:hypothetical protein ACFV6F_11795 [Kitasatospora phosalacinea]|uniref:hypothetical protein n=1 Tax=Kitasatospora phosalacinea TaxID=2065 RepID=UPI003668B27B
MAAVCPSCSLADRTVPVPTALQDRDSPLDRPTCRLLDVPPEPARGSRISTLLLLAALLSALQVLRSLVVLARTGSAAVPRELVFVGVAAAVTVLSYWASSALRRTADGRAERRRAAAGHWPVSYGQWRLVHQVWRASWLCRGCRAVFLPAGALGPDFTASGPLSFEHFGTWLTGTARQADLAGGFHR